MIDPLIILSVLLFCIGLCITFIILFNWNKCCINVREYKPQTRGGLKTNILYEEEKDNINFSEFFDIVTNLVINHYNIREFRNLPK